MEQKISFFRFNDPDFLNPFFSQIKEMDLEHFHLPWSDQAWQDLLIDPINYFLTLVWEEKEGKRVLGFALFSSPSTDFMAHLLKILILPEVRSKGWGQKILQSTFPIFASFPKEGLFLEVESSNLEAKSLYLKLGFEALHETKNYYGSGKHAVKMVRYFNKKKVGTKS